MSQSDKVPAGVIRIKNNRVVGLKRFVLKDGVPCCSLSIEEEYLTGIFFVDTGQ